MPTVEESEGEIKSLEEKIARYESQCDSATSEERKDKLLEFATEKQKSLNALYARLERLELRAQQQPQPGIPYLL